MGIASQLRSLGFRQGLGELQARTFREKLSMTVWRQTLAPVRRRITVTSMPPVVGGRGPYPDRRSRRMNPGPGPSPASLEHQLAPRGMEGEDLARTLMRLRPGSRRWRLICCWAKVQ